MKLFHGSNLEVSEPRLIEQIRGLDFGAGFYLTTNEAQANRFSDIVVNRRKDTVMPTIQAYLGGFLTEEAALITLKASRLVDQFCLKTDKALSLLRFERSYNGGAGAMKNG